MTTTSRTPHEYETESDGMRIFEEFDIKLNKTIKEIKKIFNNTIMELKEDYEEFSTRNLHEYGEREFNQMMTIKEWVVSISKYEEQVARFDLGPLTKPEWLEQTGAQAPTGATPATFDIWLYANDLDGDADKPEHRLLLKTADGKGRVACNEILFRTTALPNVIREGNNMMLYSVIQAGKKEGMQAMDDVLLQFAKDGKITGRDAYMKATDKQRFESFAEG